MELQWVCPVYQVSHSLTVQWHKTSTEITQLDARLTRYNTASLANNAYLTASSTDFRYDDRARCWLYRFVACRFVTNDLLF